MPFLRQIRILGSQGEDLGQCINEAYAGLPPSGGEIIIDRGGSFSIPIVFGVSGKVATLRGLGGNAVELIFTPTSGTAITFNNGWAFDFCSGLQNITLTGPGNSTSTVGVIVGGSNGAVGLAAEYFKIQSFGVNLKTQSNTWITRFSHGMIRDGGTNVLMPSGMTDAGENVEFDHVTFADAPTPHTNSVWIQGGGQEVIFAHCSFDQAQLRIGNGGTSAAQVCITGCHFENPNYALSGSVDYDFLVVDANNGNYVRVTDCFIEQDRSTGSNYAQFLTLQGGVVNIIGMGMFTPATLTNFAVLSGNVNVNLFAFNDLSGNISGGMFSGSTSGFVNSFPGCSTGTSSGFNSLLGVSDIAGGQKMQFGGNVAVGQATAGLYADTFCNGNLNVFLNANFNGQVAFNGDIVGTLGTPLVSIQAPVGIGTSGSPQSLVVNGTLNVTGVGDLLTAISNLQSQITTLQGDYNAHEHVAGTLSAPSGGGAVTGKTGTTDTPD